ncbi:phage holin [Metabacillus herbersteinensis]|uniref:Phage holin n=1 Tax=Metabacillus herbersteinensis TaxID=283816 RepID=A0ABV6GC34_9BACI
MKNFDRGTVIRTVLLLAALINQTLIMTGRTGIPIGEEQILSLIDAIYLVSSILFSIVTAVMAWFRNNYVTQTGQLQKNALKAQGLIKK